MPRTIASPVDTEYAEFYRGYVTGVSGTDVVGLLGEQPAQLRRLLGSLSDEAAAYRYGPGKWSIKEVAGHVADAERVFGYRLFRISRGDSTPLAGYDENAFVAAGGFDRRPMSALLAEFESARAANLAMLGGCDDASLMHVGTANGKPVSARALVYIMAGHVTHHMRILRERYGLAG